MAATPLGGLALPAVAACHVATLPLGGWVS